MTYRLLIKTLRPSSLLVLSIVVAVSTALSTVVYTGLSGLYETVTGVLGGGGDVLVVYSRSASTPLTGLIETEKIERLYNVSGVEKISVEVVLPASIEKRPVIVRGVDPEVFPEVVGIEVVAGRWLERGDTGSVVLGVEAAHRLGLWVGDTVVVRPALSSSVLLLRVVGVVKTETVSDDEVFVLIDVARSVRGLGRGLATMARIVYDPEKIDLERLYQVLDTGGGGPSPLTGLIDVLRGRGLIRVGTRYGEAALGRPERIVEEYLGRYGVTPGSIAVLGVVVLFLVSYTVAVSTATIVRWRGEELSVLLDLGLSVSRARALVVSVLVPFSVASASIGALLGALLLGLLGPLYDARVMTYTIEPRASLEIVLASIATSSLAVAAGVFSAETGVSR